jgi:hypothetical protein
MNTHTDTPSADEFNQQLTAALADAMRDYRDNDGHLTPTNPAIVYRDGHVFYESSMHGGQIMIDLQEGLGNYSEGCATGATDAEIHEFARMWMEDIATECYAEVL